MRLVERLRSTLELAEAGFLLGVMGLVSALMGAALLGPTGGFALDLLLWAAGAPLLLLGLLRLLLLLRRRRYGDLPPRDAPSRADVAIGGAALLLGIFLLALFLPRALGLAPYVTPDRGDLALCALGGAVLIVPLWMAYKFVADP